jgi:methionyl-tRNA formyltransferase
MNPIKTIFFGSTDDSLLIATALSSLPTIQIVAVVTQPPRPVGRSQTITPTPIEVWARKHNFPVLSFASDATNSSFYADEQVVVDSLMPFQAELLVSASYGQKIPTPTITGARLGGLNVHPSLLPRWRGADPVPWAILSGDHQTGVSVITLSEAFDEGKIIAQKKFPITLNDTTDPLRHTLFEHGAALLTESLPDYVSGKNKGKAQEKSGTPYARRLTREDGFEPWEAIQKGFTDETQATQIDQKFRAFTPWPGLWTTINKRVKIIACHLENNLLVLDTVQMEGKTPVSFAQFQTAYLSHP